MSFWKKRPNGYTVSGIAPRRSAIITWRTEQAENRKLNQNEERGGQMAAP